MQGEQGVIHVDVRSCMQDEFLSKVATRIGYLDGKAESDMRGTLVMGLVIDTLMHAVSEFSSQHAGQPVRILIENIHTCIDRDKLSWKSPHPHRLHDAAAAFLGALVDPWRISHRGQFNIVFTVPDHAAARLIQQQSGYSGVDVVPFPCMDDTSLHQQLLSLRYNPTPSSNAPQFKFAKDLDDCVQHGYQPVFTDANAAHEVVQCVGSHMGDINAVLSTYLTADKQATVTDEMSRVKAAVKATLDTPKRLLSSVLLPKAPLNISRYDVLEAVVARYVADAVLAQTGSDSAGVSEEVVHAKLVSAGVKGVQLDEIRGVMQQLKDKWVLAPVDRHLFHTTFYSRALKAAYQHLLIQHASALDKQLNCNIRRLKRM